MLLAAQHQLEASGLGSTILMGQVKRVPGELGVNAEGSLTSRQQLACNR
jgi:hypothetical protein